MLVLSVAVVAVALGAWLVAARDVDRPTTTAAATAASPSTDPLSGLPWVAVRDLPPEARETLELIESGGPFPYERDGAVFQNREGILPGEPSGYYHEYTVETAGSDDRGARRIVTGSDGERYYTDDHYESFRRIAE
jgi:ribonuclease T1